MNTGDFVIVTALRGERLRRQVVRVEPGSVLVCRPEEFLAAQAEAREPRAAGFPPDAVESERASGLVVERSPAKSQAGVRSSSGPPRLKALYEGTASEGLVGAASEPGDGTPPLHI